VISVAIVGDIERLKRLKGEGYDFNVVDHVSIILYMLQSTYNFTNLYMGTISYMFLCG